MQIVLENADGVGMVSAEYAASWAARPRVLLYQGQHFEQNRTDIQGRWVYRTDTRGTSDPSQTDPLLSGFAAIEAAPVPLTALEHILALFALALAPGDPVPAVLVAGLRDAVKGAWPRG